MVTKGSRLASIRLRAYNEAERNLSLSRAVSLFWFVFANKLSFRLLDRIMTSKLKVYRKKRPKWKKINETFKEAGKIVPLETITL